MTTCRHLASSSHRKDIPSQACSVTCPRVQIVLLKLDSQSVRDYQDQTPSRVDIERLMRAESRADSLRAQLINLQMREIELQAHIDELDYQMKPENIQRALSLVGSVRPMDELRANLRGRLENEKIRTSAQLELLASARTKLETAEAECDRLRELLRIPEAEDGSW